MKNVRFLLPAEQEMIEAAIHYETCVNNLGSDFISKVESAVSRISENPETWPEIGHGIRKQQLQRFPYNILYKIDQDEIIIIAVMHQRQRPYYWVNLLLRKK